MLIWASSSCYFINKYDILKFKLKEKESINLGVKEVGQ